MERLFYWMFSIVDRFPFGLESRVAYFRVGEIAYLSDHILGQVLPHPLSRNLKCAPKPRCSSHCFDMVWRNLPIFVTVCLEL